MPAWYHKHERANQLLSYLKKLYRRAARDMQVSGWNRRIGSPHLKRENDDG